MTKHAAKALVAALALIVLLAVPSVRLMADTIDSAPSAEDQRVPVLLYHHILSDDENKRFTDNAAVISLENFAEQMKYLHENQYHTITPDELYEFLYHKKALPPKSVFIQFDDGYYSNIVRAYPVLKEYGFKATVFTITCTAVGPQVPFNPDDLQYISTDSMPETKDVFTYQSHTHDLHKPIDGKTKFMSASTEEIIDDLKQSFAITDSRLSFAYPLGQHNSEKIAALKEAGVEMAFIVYDGYVGVGDDPYRLKRLSVFQDMPMEDFITYLENAQLDIRRVNAQLLNVRIGPGTEYEKIGSITYDATVQVVSESDGWCEIAWHGGAAYVSGSYLR